MFNIKFDAFLRAREAYEVGEFVQRQVAHDGEEVGLADGAGGDLPHGVIAEEVGTANYMPRRAL